MQNSYDITHYSDLSGRSLTSEWAEIKGNFVWFERQNQGKKKIICSLHFSTAILIFHFENITNWVLPYCSRVRMSESWRCNCLLWVKEIKLEGGICYCQSQGYKIILPVYKPVSAKESRFHLFLYITCILQQSEMIFLCISKLIWNWLPECRSFMIQCSRTERVKGPTVAAWQCCGLNPLLTDQ